MKLFILLCSFAICTIVVGADVKEDVVVEQTTESPNAERVGDATPTETLKEEKEKTKPTPENSPQHTIADFIIHPLIALKPRVPETENGKQSDGSSTTSSPWQLFGFNAGQGLGSSVSSLAGSVTGWLGNRIQLPGFVETPVREASTTSTTTTVRPDVVVRLQQRPATRKPLITINNSNNKRPYRRYNRPNRYNFVDYVDDSAEDNDYSNDYDNFEVKRKNRRRYQNYAEEYEDDDDDEEEQQLNYEENENNESGEEQKEDQSAEDDQETEDEVEERPQIPLTTKRNRRPNPNNHNNRKRNFNSRNQLNQKKQHKKPEQEEEEESVEEDQYDEEDDEQNFYYNTNQDSKRSQNELNIIQRGQQSLLKQLKQFTGGQTPAEVANILNKNQKSRKPLQQATLLIKRNGQTVYVAPELLQKTKVNSNKVTVSTNKPLANNYPQPPLSLPYKRKGQPIQYITIPWNQLGISTPNQLNSLMEGVQSQPLILSIPQKAIENMQKGLKKNKRPGLTAEAVPLLAEASAMDVFKPPRIQPVKTPSNKPAILVSTNNKIGAARIRPNTVVGKTPLVQVKKEDKENKDSSESWEDAGNQSPHFIVIADEPVNPKLSRSTYKQIIDYFQHNRSGRQLNDEKVTAEVKEQLKPVPAITGEDEPLKTDVGTKNELEATTESTVALESLDTTTEKISEENTTNQAETIDQVDMSS